jgi:hypothetical protein
MLTPDQSDNNGMSEPDEQATPDQAAPPVAPVPPDQPPTQAAPPLAPVPPDQPPAQAAPPVAPAPPDQPPAQAAPPAPPDGGVPKVQIDALTAGNVNRVTVLPGSAGGVKEAKLGALPRAGLKLAVMVGGIIAVVTIMVLIDWWRAPGIPPNFSSMKADDAKAVAENLKILSDMSIDRSVKIFDDIVGKTLLPVFTSILGYIFGTRGGDSSNPPSPNPPQ